MAKKGLKLRRKGIRELMTSDEIAEVVENIAKDVQATAGDGYIYNVHKGKKRVNASVHPHTPKASHDNMENNTLMKSVKSWRKS